MREELATIDVAPLEQLTRLKAESDTLEGRLEAMEQRRASVAEAVYTRVRADYETRRAALEAEAAPLKAAARAQYVKLFALISRSEADHEAARLDREEIEFRFSLGEFDQAEYQRRVAGIDSQLSERAAVREAALALRQRFVDAFRSEEDLRSAEPAAPAPPPPAPALLPSDMPTQKLTPIDPAVLGVTPPHPQPHLGASPPQATTVMSIPMSGTPTLPPPPQRPAPPPPAVDGYSTQTMQVIKGDPAKPPRADQTVIIRGARLVPQNAAAGKLTHTVSLRPALIGSGEDCDVRVSGAQPRHAEVKVSMAGYTISDLGGGVRVNGIVIEQHLLRHEDVIEVGPAHFTFKEG